MHKLERSLSSLILTLRCVFTNWCHYFHSLECSNYLLFSINQCCSFSSMHPPSPINLGEAWTKEIYEAVRGSPQWNNTLFIITFDEHGVCNKVTQIRLRFTNLPQGFSDHVPPPVGVPNPDNLTYTETAADGKKYTFNFTRLGVRCVSIWKHFFLHIPCIFLSVPTIAISPWVQEGIIEHSGINNGLTYSHSSIAGFISNAKPFYWLIIFLILIDYCSSASSGISTTAFPWHPV